MTTPAAGSQPTDDAPDQVNVQRAAALASVNDAVHVTPKVRRLANEHAVNLTQVVGTGVGGRVRPDDVYAAAGVRKAAAKPGPASAVVSTSSRPRLIVVEVSRFDQFKRVEIDSYGLNPLAEDLKQSQPALWSAAVEFDPHVPTLFSTGNLPLFTAAGFDPQLLLRLPWVIRPLAASTEKASLVAEIFERCGGPADMGNAAAAQVMAERSEHGTGSYRRRFDAWTDAPFTAQPEQIGYITAQGVQFPAGTIIGKGTQR